MTFVVYRDHGADGAGAVPVMTATNVGRAKAIARTLAARVGVPYHVRVFRAEEGRWVEGGSYYPPKPPPEGDDPSVEVEGVPPG